MKKMVKPNGVTKLRNAAVVGVMSAVSASVTAQESVAPISPLEQTMYNSGKIWVVVAVAAVILLGIFAYLIRVDRVVSQLEDEMNQRLKQS